MRTESSEKGKTMSIEYEELMALAATVRRVG